MQLLLLLSALLTGLTGLMGGERPLETQQLERSAVAAAAAVDAVQTASAAIETTVSMARQATFVVVSDHYAFAEAAPRSFARVDERRLE